MSVRGSGSVQKALAGDLGALRWALEHDSDDAGANHALIIMGWKANTSWEFFMSLENFAKLMPCHVRTVQRKIEHLLLRVYRGCELYLSSAPHQYVPSVPRLNAFGDNSKPSGLADISW